MTLFVDAFVAWLVEQFADAGRKKLTTIVLGTEQERALRVAAAAAVRRTAEELRPDDDERAEQLALVISQVFGDPVPSAPLARHKTMVEALQAEIAGHLLILDDASLTGTEQSSADLLEVPSAVLAEKLTGHLLWEIVMRGSRGGPLFPLASQLNDDLTHLQGRRLEDLIGLLAEDLKDILARFSSSSAVVAAPVALQQLPPVADSFTGRDAELATLIGVLDPREAMVVAMITGPPGIGKTALAVKAGHSALDRRWFAGAALFVDLHGFDEVPVDPAQALDALLRALGVPGERIPPSLATREALYRSEMAKIGDPVLVIADNASAVSQVQPLLTGIKQHKVVVTSRRTLVGLDARLINVPNLDVVAGVKLLKAVMRLAQPDDPRITGEPQAAQRLAEACGGFPLALQIVAGQLKAHPKLTVAQLADELSDKKERLQALRDDDGSRSVAAAFQLSYGKLDETAQRSFRMLSVNPGPDLSTEAVTVLMALPLPRVRTSLRRLESEHLIEAAPGPQDRWRMYDPLRLFAQQQSDRHADSDAPERARERLFGYYLAEASTAGKHLQALPGKVARAELANPDAALVWLDAERPNLVAAVNMAAQVGLNQVASGLPLALGHYFYRQRRFDDWLDTLRVGRTAASQIHDREREGNSLVQLGWVLTERRKFKEAIDACHDAVKIFVETGDQRGKAGALTNRGHALRGQDRFEQGINAYQAAASIYTETGDELGLGIVRTNLGLALAHLRRLEEAITAHQEAVDIFQHIEDRREEAAALTNLGHTQRDAGRSEQAIRTCQKAVETYQDIGDPHGPGTALDELGMALQEAGCLEEAIARHEEALSVFRKTKDRHGEGISLSNVGLALRKARRFDDAIAACRDAVAIFKETEDLYSAGIALGRLGLSLQDVGRFEDAVAAHEENLAVCKEIDDQHGEAEVLDNLGVALQGCRRFADAITMHRDAAAVFLETGDRRGEDTALEHLVMVRAAQQT